MVLVERGRARELVSGEKFAQEAGLSGVSQPLLTR